MHDLAVEDPSYRDWLSVNKSGPRHLPVSLDEEGLDVSHLTASGAGGVRHAGSRLSEPQSRQAIVRPPSTR
ncbi:hypothetical protein [Mesorhizobium sp. ES1-4]|uniref:hypothetical protein n=1 Tax=Mesorhizobium sp. ES1-4 TaxID=2876627 RepID=UPI001CD00531|nr:hypothetical protein [Mesorhizobium sp. ES1-4]MBZ9796928.1 hypothetical protein [Mesorhizobium sp. ES1-4]